MKSYIVLWIEIGEQLNVSLKSVVINDAYVNPKLTVGEGKFKTIYNIVYLNTVYLNTENVYEQCQKYYRQVFVK